jgi:nitroreductase
MDVREAVETRFSCRAFRPDPVPETVVRDILARAARTPSGGNLQPWRVDALTGAPLAALLGELAGRMGELPMAEGAEYIVYPLGLKEPYKSRRFAVGEALYASIDVPRTDRVGRYRQFARNFALFGAPVGLFVSIDRTMGPPQWSDMGMFVQTILLLARAHGLHTCAQEAWTHWHKTLNRHLELPETHMLFCGIALGHGDLDDPINRWRSEREGVDGFATLKGW